eukprot:284817836_3
MTYHGTFPQRAPRLSVDNTRTIVAPLAKFMRIRCAITMVVRLRVSRSLSNVFTIFSDSLSSALVASSRIRIAGSRRMARAIAIRCFCPPLSWLPPSPPGRERDAESPPDGVPTTRCCDITSAAPSTVTSTISSLAVANFPSMLLMLPLYMSASGLTATLSWRTTRPSLICSSFVVGAEAALSNVRTAKSISEELLTTTAIWASGGIETASPPRGYGPPMRVLSTTPLTSSERMYAWICSALFEMLKGSSTTTFSIWSLKGSHDSVNMTRRAIGIATNELPDKLTVASLISAEAVMGNFLAYPSSQPQPPLVQLLPFLECLLAKSV